MAVTIPDPVLARYRMFSLYNSPYTAHDRGAAIDLYPDPGTAPSPVAGEVLDTRSVTAPPKAYAEADDHLILVDVESPAPLSGYTARILHVDPGVDPGDRVAVGDQLGRTIRSGFFAPWVDDHLHVGFRESDANPYRASGSVRVAVTTPIARLEWDGRGTVVETGDTYAILDRPVHPSPGEGFAGIADDDGRGVLDGGYPHYDGGGLLPAGVDDRDRAGVGSNGPVSLLGTRIGTADDRTIVWDDRTVLVDGDSVLGLSLYCGRDRAGAKVVCPDTELAVGDDVLVRIE